MLKFACMKKPIHLNLFLLPTMAFILALHGKQAYANGPVESDFSESKKLSNNNLDDANFDHLLDYRNMKGERIFAPNHPTGVQENLWSLLDPTLDHIEGTSTERTYLDPRFPRAGKTIIVAVIDSGIDIHHEDLQGKIWTNTKEIPGNGIDDDGNGFVDDVHGWNFLGNKNGENIDTSTLEITREVVRLTNKNKEKKLRGAEAAYFRKIKTQFNTELAETKKSLQFYQSIITAIELLRANGLNNETPGGVLSVPGHTQQIADAKNLVMRVFEKGYTTADIQHWIDDSNGKINFGYNLNFDPSKVIGDHPNILNEVGYGNNDVIGPDAMHGTHVAGIIAALRENHVGILGQADAVQIMPIRAIPNGDERDKDVANAIIYAVKNGANVINMSFGKEYSPHKSYVDKAVAFAEKHGVIIIHAAGNDGKNTESTANNYPNNRLFNNSASAHQATNWIEVGASNKNKDETLPANFSNWGKTSVDLFAPGMAIDSSIPGNQYKELQGTSMASPEVAGVVALLLGHFPNKTPAEVMKAVITTTNQYPGLIVNLPGTNGKEQISFSQLSKTGGTVNAFKAMEALLKQ